jgi:hypothetical protein
MYKNFIANKGFRDIINPEIGQKYKLDSTVNNSERISYIS